MTNFFESVYIPILSISPAEMNAIKELPNKDKDLILPLFPLKGWVASKLLNNTTNKIKDVFGDRPWVADIDSEYLVNAEDENGDYPREVFNQISALHDSQNGYENWCNYISNINAAIPTIQIDDLTQLDEQISRLNCLEKGLVVRVSLSAIASGYYSQLLHNVAKTVTTDVMVIFDLEQITSNEVNPAMITNLCSVIRIAHTIIPKAKLVVSASSFPSSFSPYTRGENSIYERILFTKLQNTVTELTLAYSDRGSARAVKNGGGGGVPKPRIDYPLLNDWRFIRRNSGDTTKQEKAKLYSEVAREIMASDYWDNDLKLWGTQMIELTGLEDDFGIDNPGKSTAVRINIHLHNQLHYNSPRSSLIDTDENWED